MGRENTTFKLKDATRLYKEVKGRITKEHWQKAELHVIEKVEMKFWELDNIQSEVVYYISFMYIFIFHY